ncbi:TPA: phage tail protein I [Escherichia coli]|nr:phage tail protein I [Escherichia coli]
MYSSIELARNFTPTGTPYLIGLAMTDTPASIGTERNWPEETRRQVIRDAWMIHRHKGTISALRRIVEPLGYLIRVSEWWEFDGSPGTFTIEIGTLETGVSEELHEEMERLIADARPVSRHLVGLSIIQEIHGAIYAAAAGYDGDIITIYPED